jgi:hypothetical protein
MASPDIPGRFTCLAQDFLLRVGCVKERHRIRGPVAFAFHGDHSPAASLASPIPRNSICNRSRCLCDNCGAAATISAATLELARQVRFSGLNRYADAFADFDVGQCAAPDGAIDGAFGNTCGTRHVPRFEQARRAQLD